jgi:hypothetical protein
MIQKTSNLCARNTLYEVCSLYGPFDEVFSHLKKTGFELMTPLQLISLQRSDDACHGSYVAQEHHYDPQRSKMVFVLNKSACAEIDDSFLNNYQSAMATHKKNEEWVTNNREVRIRASENLDEAIKSGVLALDRNSLHQTMRWDRLHKSVYLRFCFENDVKEMKRHGKFLRDDSSNFMRNRNDTSFSLSLLDESYVQKQTGPFARLVSLSVCSNSQGFGSSMFPGMESNNKEMYGIREIGPAPLAKESFFDKFFNK